VLSSSLQTLELGGFKVSAAASPEPVLPRIDRLWPGVVITDVRMPEMDGLEFLKTIHDIDPDIPVIIITGHGDITMAIRAIRHGAYEFIEKPGEPDHLIEITRRALAHRALVLENRVLRAELVGRSGMERTIIGRSDGIDRVRATIANLAATNVDILIIGETGTGKEVVARSLHEFSPRRTENFVAVNCGAIPENLIESELFGHEAGAFTGAHARRIGKIESSSGGTLFLDEIESMPMQVQVRLLRVLQERVVERVGGNKPIPLDIRVVAAVKVDLLQQCAEGKFREDLYYRLNVARIPLPPLRERKDDIPLLFRHFLDLAAMRYQRPSPEVTSAMLASLARHDWPGNVRELRNAAERLVLGLAEEHLPQDGSSVESGDHSLTGQIERFERQVIEMALAACNGRIGETAERLGIVRKTLYLKMRKYGLHREDDSEE
jgi:two-component system C4-dicarboxylate transport response regulator DctD